MISVDEALAHLFALVSPIDTETIPLARAHGRVLRAPVNADRDQPPFDASAMDGYAVRLADAAPGRELAVIGTAAAGAAFGGHVSEGEAVRIFTGAPMPEGAERVVIQEDTESGAENTITIRDTVGPQTHVRPRGGDFRAGDSIPHPRRLRPVDLARIAAMNCPAVSVARRPVVAIIATGDELVMPGGHPRADQIIASNSFALAAMVEAAGATARVLPIARDEAWALRAAFGQASDADLILTSGGASVGDHDLVGPVTEALGMERSFYRVAMRPGKPLMAGRMGRAIMIGLPGNPVSAIVCGHIFVLPVLDALQGLPARRRAPLHARLSANLGANGPREHYMRAETDGQTIAALGRQDSSLLSVLGEANALLIRPVGDGPRKRGETVNYIPL